MRSMCALFAVSALALCVGSGCIIGVYSKQDYGPGASVMAVAQDQSLAEVIGQMGAPDKVLEIGDTKILVYTQYEGMQVLGVYSKVRKKDIVVILKGGKVSQPPLLVSKGEAMTILGAITTPIFGPTLNKEE